MLDGLACPSARARNTGKEVTTFECVICWDLFSSLIQLQIVGASRIVAQKKKKRLLIDTRTKQRSIKELVTGSQPCYRYFRNLLIDIDINIFQNLLIIIDIDIFQNLLIDINIDNFQNGLIDSDNLKMPFIDIYILIFFRMALSMSISIFSKFAVKRLSI